MPQLLDDRPSVNLLWFKRDLRLRDHAPLKAVLAACQGSRPWPLLLLYCFEPSLVADPNYELRHWRFVQESLSELNKQLATLLKPITPAAQGLPLVHEWLPFEFDDQPRLAQPLPPAGPTVIWVFYREVIEVLQALQT